MASVPSANVESPRERLARKRAALQALRDKARQQYASGAPGLQIASLISELTDRLVVELFEEALRPLPESERRTIQSQTAMVAVGGSGRGELAPYSDADLLFLAGRQRLPHFADAVARMVRDCWDAGIKLGHSVRTMDNALSMARREPQFATSLIEARRVWGDERLFQALRWKFYRKIVRFRQAAFYADCVAAREAERTQFGATARQLQPDVKRSLGGLRDLHLIRWLGYARFGTTEIDLLRLEGALSREDAQTLLTAQEYLTRIRVELHFAAGKAQEVLTREEQLRLAELYGIEDGPGQRGVERFMQGYFMHTAAVAEIANRFIARHRPVSLPMRITRLLLTHRSNTHFLVSPDYIEIVTASRAYVLGDLARVLNIFELAGLYDVQLAPRLVEDIKQAVAHLVEPPSPQASRIFLAILDRGGRVGTLLRGMYATGVLERMIPEFTHARCLLQFNQYHSYTVDEHSLMAIESAEALETAPGPVAAAYREIRHKNILLLALLLHDLGKGYEEPHSEVGRRIAAAVADRLQLSPRERDLLVFLVHKHLNMAHLAFRRDLSDNELLARFARDVGSPEYLRMLYVVTAADITAVGPGTWTEWKSELLTALYDRALVILSGEHQHFGEPERIKHLKQRVHDVLVREDMPEARRILTRLDELLQTFPPHYLLATAPDQIAADLHGIECLSERPVVVRTRYEQGTNTVEYRVITREEISRGPFSKITGALTAKRLEILSANICTTSAGVIVDSFRVVDSDHVGEIPEFRMHEVEIAIVEVLTGARSVESLFQRHTRFMIHAQSHPLTPEPTRIVIDNETSDRCTIVDVFAHDRPGLLYAISAVLLELDLSVSLAKITTHVDQVVDVFYVTDRAGAKLYDDAQLQLLHDRLVQRISEFEHREATPTPA